MSDQVTIRIIRFKHHLYDDSWEVWVENGDKIARDLYKDKDSGSWQSLLNALDGAKARALQLLAIPEAPPIEKPKP